MLLLERTPAESEPRASSPSLDAEAMLKEVTAREPPAADSSKALADARRKGA